MTPACGLRQLAPKEGEGLDQEAGLGLVSRETKRERLWVVSQSLLQFSWVELDPNARASTAAVYIRRSPAASQSIWPSRSDAVQIPWAGRDGPDVGRHRRPPYSNGLYQRSGRGHERLQGDPVAMATDLLAQMPVRAAPAIVATESRVETRMRSLRQSPNALATRTSDSVLVGTAPPDPASGATPLRTQRAGAVPTKVERMLASTSRSGFDHNQTLATAAPATAMPRSTRKSTQTHPGRSPRNPRSPIALVQIGITHVRRRSSPCRTRRRRSRRPRRTSGCR